MSNALQKRIHNKMKGCCQLSIFILLNNNQKEIQPKIMIPHLRKKLTGNVYDISHYSKDYCNSDTHTNNEERIINRNLPRKVWMK
jgi:hypothetical protein